MTWGQVDPTSPIAQMLGVSTANAVEQNETERGSEPAAASSEKPAEAGNSLIHHAHHDSNHCFAFKARGPAEGSWTPYHVIINFEVRYALFCGS